MKTTENNGLHIEFESIDFTVEWRELQFWLIENGAEYKNRQWTLTDGIDEFFKMKGKYIDEPLKLQAEKYSKRRKLYHIKYGK